MIGIFDSGIGGLSVFREIRKVLPEQSYVYYSDNAHCPYGEKTREYIIDRARAITRFLLEKGWYSALGSDCHRLKTIKEHYTRDTLTASVVSHICHLGRTK